MRLGKEMIAFLVAALVAAGTLGWVATAWPGEPRLDAPEERKSWDERAVSVPTPPDVGDDPERWLPGDRSPWHTVSNYTPMARVRMGLPPAPPLPVWVPRPSVRVPWDAVSPETAPAPDGGWAALTEPTADEDGDDGDIQSPADVLGPQKRDEVLLVSGTTLEGEIVEESSDRLTFLVDGEERPRTILRDNIAEIRRRKTLGEIWSERSDAIEQGDLEARLELAEWALERDMTDQAVRELERAVAENPRNLQVVLRLSRLQLERGLPNDALAILREAVQRGVDKPEILYFEMGEVLLRAGLYDRAAAHYAAGQDVFFHPPARIARADALERAGRTEEARRAVTAALRDAPRSPTTDDERRLLARILLVRGRLAMADGDLDAALTDFDQALAETPADARLLRHAAAVLAARGEWDGAMERLDLALEGADPADIGRVRGDRALALLMTGAAQEAWDEAVLAAREDPSAPVPLMVTAVILRERGDTAAARASVEEAVGRAPEDADAHAQWALVHRAAGDLGDAESEARAAIGRNFGHPHAFAVLAAVRVERAVGRNPEDESVEDAVRTAARARELTGGDPAALALEARALMIAGRASAAAPVLERALRDETRPAPTAHLHAHLAWAQYERGRDAQALSALQQAAAGGGDAARWAEAIVPEVVFAVRHRRWTDEFDRGDQPVVGNNWTEDDRLRINITLDSDAASDGGPAAVLEGTALDSGESRLERTVPTARLRRVQAVVHVDRARMAEVGLRVGGRTREDKFIGIALMRDAEGDLVLVRPDDTRTTIQPWGDGPLELAVDLVDRGQNLWQVRVDGAPAGEPFKGGDMTRRRDLTVGLFARSLQAGADVKAIVDRVEVIEERSGE